MNLSSVFRAGVGASVFTACILVAPSPSSAQIIIFGEIGEMSTITVTQATVFKKWVTVPPTTPEWTQWLKVLLPNGSKVAADCMHSDCILSECINSTIGAAATGFASCTGGYCTWLEFASDHPSPPGCPEAE